MAGDTASPASDDEHERIPDSSDKRGYTVLPALYYSPDRGLAASAAVLRYFQTADDAGRPSEIRVEATLSTRGELGLYLIPTLWLPGDEYKLRASLGVNQRERSFFGVGNDTADGAEELYTTRFLSLYTEASRQIVGGLRAGVTGYIKQLGVLEVAGGGLLDADTVSGADGGRISGLGGLLEYDTRDSVYGPRNGYHVRAVARLYDSIFFSNFEYLAVVLDARAYLPLRWNATLGVQGRVEMRFGDTPFFDLSMAGGKSMLRGMLNGRYRDAHFAGAQVEYRVPVWWRIGAVTFAGLGRVAGGVGEFDLGGWRYSLGAGLRFAVVPKKRINVRLDVGTSDGDVNFYVDILEAF